jgi:hypothetical protein
MFDSGGRGTVFDNLRLAIQFREVEIELHSGILPYSIGHLRWTNSVWEDGGQENRRPQGEFSGVYMEELTEEDRLQGKEGSFKFFRELPVEFLNRCIKDQLRDDDDGALKPDPESLLVASFDPTDYVLKRDVAEGSMNAGHGGFIYDPALETMGIATDVLLWEYYFRHENPDDTKEDVIKTIIYTGCRMIIEANKKWLVTAVKLEGLHHFLLLKQKDGSIRPYQAGDENDLVNTTQDMINAYCRAINRYWAKPKTLADIDKLTTVKTLILLAQAMDFDATDTKKSDTVVSYGYWRLAVESFSVYIIQWRLDNSDDDGGTMETAFNALIFG